MWFVVYTANTFDLNCIIDQDGLRKHRAQDHKDLLLLWEGLLRLNNPLHRYVNSRRGVTYLLLYYEFTRARRNIVYHDRLKQHLVAAKAVEIKKRINTLSMKIIAGIDEKSGGLYDPYEMECLFECTVERHAYTDYNMAVIRNVYLQPQPIRIDPTRSMDLYTYIDMCKYITAYTDYKRDLIRLRMYKTVPLRVFKFLIACEISSGKLTVLKRYVHETRKYSGYVNHAKRKIAKIILARYKNLVAE